MSCWCRRVGFNGGGREMRIGFRTGLVTLSAIQLLCLSRLGTAQTVTQETARSPATDSSNLEPAGVKDQKAVGALEEIVVTAQKRSESINKVGMSIGAASGDTLIERGITTVGDLEKIVPGLTFTPSQT